MGHRLSKIYTRTGDEGSTGLADGRRLPKTSPLLELIGEVDELNSHLGVLRAALEDATLDELLSEIQHDLFDLGGELAIAGSEAVTEARVAFLEQAIDLYNAELPPLKEFILPAGNAAAASCHVARAVARRVERRAHAVATPGDLGVHGRAYLNRLSDLLFVLARTIARRGGGTEVTWNRSR